MPDLNFDLIAVIEPLHKIGGSNGRITVYALDILECCMLLQKTTTVLIATDTISSVCQN